MTFDHVFNLYPERAFFTKIDNYSFSLLKSGSRIMLCEHAKTWTLSTAFSNSNCCFTFLWHKIMTLRLLPSILVYLHRYISPYIVGTTEISETLGFFLASPQTSFGVRLSRIHFSPTWGRNECVTNEPQRTSAGRLGSFSIHLHTILTRGHVIIPPRTSILPCLS